MEVADMPASGASVLCVDDDRDIAEIVQAVLEDEGYAVSCIYTIEHDALARAVGRLEPDCILLDGTSPMAFNAWQEAAAMATRWRRVPVVMFTGHTKDLAEARANTSDRAIAADFAAILEKPFNLDALLEAVATATGRSVPFDRTPAGERTRTRELVTAFEQRGATEIEPSKRREWATFRDPKQHLCQIYWWQGRGVYQVGRYTEAGKLALIGQFIERDVAIDMALPEQGAFIAGRRRAPATVR
jgi:CheY-like chemotaxis protein